MARNGTGFSAAGQNSIGQGFGQKCVLDVLGEHSQVLPLSYTRESQFAQSDLIRVGLSIQEAHIAKIFANHGPLSVPNN